MARYRRALIVAGAVTACTPAPPPIAQTVTPSASVAVAPPPPVVVDAGPSKPPAPTSQCKPLGPNQVSDDDHPQVAGVGTQDLGAMAWLEKHEVAPKTAKAWIGAREGLKPGEIDSEYGRFTDLYCHEAKMGDPTEEGLVCRLFPVKELTEDSVMGVVVRKKQPVAVFQVGLAMGAMDFPEARHLDLAFRLSPDGKSFDVSDRAPDGTMLVVSPTVCLAREHRPDQGEPPAMEPMGLPATLHDCEGAKKILGGMVSSSKGDSRFHPIAVSGNAFVTKACKDRGHWTWNKDKFAWGPPLP